MSYLFFKQLKLYFIIIIFLIQSGVVSFPAMESQFSDSERKLM